MKSSKWTWNVIKKVVLAIRGGSAFPKSDSPIELAFTCGGIDYFQHVDENKLPYKRALAALTIYQEISAGVDSFFITKWGEAFDNLCNGNKFGAEQLAELIKLRKIMKQRLDYIQPADLYYKLASIRFFTAEENITEYDWKYNMAKIEAWKKSQDVDGFFLSRPVQKLIPYLKGQSENLSYSFQLAEELDKIHLESIYTNLLPEQKTTFDKSLSRFFWKEMQPKKSD